MNAVIIYNGILRNMVDDPNIGAIIPRSQACKAVYTLCMKQKKRQVGVTWGGATMLGFAGVVASGGISIVAGFVLGNLYADIEYANGVEECTEDYDLCCSLCPLGQRCN